MNEGSAFGAALSLVGGLLLFAIWARRHRPVDPYERAKRELATGGDEFRPLEPEGNIQAELDEAVDSANRGCGFMNLIFSVFILAVVLYLAVVDPVTRIVVLVTLLILAGIVGFSRVANR